MNKIELKPRIFIEGFNTPLQRDNRILELLPKIGDSNQEDPILYWQKTSEIPEELASQCCKYQNSYEGELFYKGYGNITWSTYPYVTAKESIQSACPNEFCIIYKTTQK